MLFNDRESMRQIYIDVWQKQDSKTPLQPLEAQLLDVMQQHPEFHQLFESSEHVLSAEFTGTEGEANPFLHMGLHMAIREQLQTDRPVGIVKIYQSLLDKNLPRHDIEHKMMTVLADFLWQSQQTGQAPDEAKYLLELGKLG